MSEVIEPFERLMLFFYCLEKAPREKEKQIDLFRKISGMSEAEAQSALDVCILKGFVGDKPTTEHEEQGCPGGGARSPRDPAFNPNHDFEGTDTCRQCGASKYTRDVEDDE